MKLRVILFPAALALASNGGCSDDPVETNRGPVTFPTFDSGGTGGGAPAAEAGAPLAPVADAAAPADGSVTPLDASMPPAMLDAGMPPADAGGASDAAASDATVGDATAGDDAGGDAASGDAAIGDGGGTASGTCLKGTGDYKAAGPYKFKSKQVTIGSSGAFTIVYPDPLEAACPHPIVAWGNGTFITGGTAYSHFNEHAASWGIVSIASHNSNVGDGSFHRAAIDYLIAQNKQSGSEFFGKLNERAGVSGHSQGGAGADRASSHPNVKAIVNVQGSFGNAPMSSAAFLCLTGTEDIATTGCPAAARAAKVPAMSASYDGADHVSTTLFEGTGSDQYVRLYSAWFRCFLADDENACAMFKGGANCPVCKDPGWDEIFAVNY